VKISTDGRLILRQLIGSQNPVDVDFKGGTLEKLLRHLADQ